MKITTAILMLILSAACSSVQNITGTYQNYCRLYNQPRHTLILRADKTFLYNFPYVEDKIEGSWAIDRDSLILKSDYFLKESEPNTPIRKYTDIPNGKDVYIVKGKRLYAVMKNGVEKTCYMTVVSK